MPELRSLVLFSFFCTFCCILRNKFRDLHFDCKNKGHALVSRFSVYLSDHLREKKATSVCQNENESVGKNSPRLCQLFPNKQNHGDGKLVWLRCCRGHVPCGDAPALQPAKLASIYFHLVIAARGAWQVHRQRAPVSAAGPLAAECPGGTTRRSQCADCV